MLETIIIATLLILAILVLIVLNIVLGMELISTILESHDRHEASYRFHCRAFNMSHKVLPQAIADFLISDAPEQIQ